MKNNEYERAHQTSQLGSLLRQFYKIRNGAMWTLGACILVIFLINLPDIWEARAQTERQRMEEIILENRDLCEKWGQRAGTPESRGCMADLDSLRTKDMERFANEAYGM